MSNTTTNTYTMDNEIKVRCVKDATEGIDSSWYRSYGQHGVYAKKAGIDFKSNMIWGSQFDQVIMWLKDVRNPSQGEHVYYVINSTGMKGTSTSKTGQVKVKNIYDLSGGIKEATPTVKMADTIWQNGNVSNVKATRFCYDILPNRTDLDYYENNYGSSRLVLF